MRYYTNIFAVYLTLFLAFIVNLLPWFGQGISWRPDFVLLVLIFWVIRAPQLCNIGVAWFAGLLMDLATGGLFGQFALAYALTTFFAANYQRRLVLYNIWQQAAYVFVLLMLSQLTILMLKLFTGHDVPSWHYFFPSIMGIILWQIYMVASGQQRLNQR